MAAGGGTFTQGPRIAWACALGAAILSLWLAAGAASGTAAGPSRVVVALVGPGAVTSTPAGISCPGRCTTTFAAGTRVVLTPRSRSGSRFVRWGGSCTGAGGCRLGASPLSAVAAQFAAGKRHPPAAPRVVAEPGTYSLHNSYKTFFVAPGGRSLRNVAIGNVPIACTPVASAAPAVDIIVIDRAPIRADGTFAAKGTQRGLLAGVPATFTYSFSGRFTAASAREGASAAGTLREEIVFTDNVRHRCTSNDQPWTASKTGPIPQPSSLVRPGKYSLHNTYKTFAVAPGGRSIVNVAIGGVALACNPAASGVPTSDQIVIPKVAVAADGSFAARSVRSGVFAGAPATFTSTFAGSFQGADRYGRITVGGVLREDVAFTDAGGTHTCTSNTQAWIGSS